MAARWPYPAVVLAAAATTIFADHITVDPRATYLRTSEDVGAKDSPAIPLSSLGAKPGDWLRIERTGKFASTLGGPADGREVIGVFSNSEFLFPPDFRDRVPGALATKGSRAVTTATTYYGNLDTDIDEDFSVDDGVIPCATVHVPKSASHVFLTVDDGLFGDNTDADGDFGVEITLVDGPCYAGFVDDCVLDLFDFLGFQNAFVARDGSADCTKDGVFDLFDFLCFVNAFNAGC